MKIDQSNVDIGPGAEAAAAAMLSWIDAVETQDFDRLEDIFDDDMEITCDPSAAGGRLNKQAFIEIDRHILESQFDIISFTARRCEDAAITTLITWVKERFRDFGPGMPSPEELAEQLGASPCAYSSMWREGPDGSWRCVQHHIFGPIGRYR